MTLEPDETDSQQPDDFLGDIAPQGGGGDEGLAARVDALERMMTHVLENLFPQTEAVNSDAELFPVTLTSTGGATGTKTTTATYVYTAVDTGGVTVGTSLTPEWPRPNGTMTAATKGICRRTAGTVTLAIAYEKPGTGAC